jgi:hypothetical protein
VGEPLSKIAIQAANWPIGQLANNSEVNCLSDQQVGVNIFENGNQATIPPVPRVLLRIGCASESTLPDQRSRRRSGLDSKWLIAANTRFCR